MTLHTVFLGSPIFAVPCLEALAHDDLINVCLVVTQPDRPAGRGRKITSPPVKVAATELGLPVIQPESVRSSEVQSTLTKLSPDLLVVVAYGELLPDSILSTATQGAINVHPSLLPRYRGSTPIQASILNGDLETGISMIYLTRRLDAGPILASYPISIEPNATTGSLQGQLATVAADHICDVSKQWIAGKINPVEQDENLASYTSEWNRDNALISWNSSAQNLERLIRASQPWPVAWTSIEGHPFRIHSARESSDELPAQPGTVQRSNRDIAVATGAGSLVLDEVQPAGKRKMQALDWWNGLQVEMIVFDDDRSSSRDYQTTSCC